MKPFEFSRTIDWLEEIARGIIDFLIGVLGMFLWSKLKDKWQQGLLWKKWTLNGLGGLFVAWTLLMFLSWIVFTVSAATQQGFGSGPGIFGYLTTTIGFMLSVGFPGLALSRLAQRLDPDHWVARMTDSSSSGNMTKETARKRNLFKDRPSYIQAVSNIHKS